ncbi:MAG: Ppx/GppA family phosphatase [Rhodobacteraceae bacterium]|nr:Ppx/GppA family phosphatase [Paracoccaceae bacterium]
MTDRHSHNPRGNSGGKRRSAGRNAVLSRKPLYAALDLGTNSCRMLIAEPDGAHFNIVDAFSKSVRLGLDLERTGALSNAGINRTLQALHVCSRKLKKLGVKNSRLVATEACRRAKNGEQFMDRIRNETGLRLEVIKPAEEARLAVVSCSPLLEPMAEHVLVVDIGGGSTELVWIDLTEVAPQDKIKAMIDLRPGEVCANMLPGARIVDWISVPLGVATLMQRFSDVQEDGAKFALMACHFEDALEAFTPYHELVDPSILSKLQVIGTSGTVTTLGAMHLGLRRYDRNKVDGLRMRAQDVNVVIERFLELGPEGRRREPGIGNDRADLIMSGSAILQTLLRIWPTESVRVADRGLREGMLFSMMNADGVLENRFENDG